MSRCREIGAGNVDHLVSCSSSSAIPVTVNRIQDAITFNKVIPFQIGHEGSFPQIPGFRETCTVSTANGK